MEAVNISHVHQDLNEEKQLNLSQILEAYSKDIYEGTVDVNPLFTDTDLYEVKFNWNIGKKKQLFYNTIRATGQESIRYWIKILYGDLVKPEIQKMLFNEEAAQPNQVKLPIEVSYPFMFSYIPATWVVNPDQNEK